MAVVTMVSLRVGQVTRDNSWRTCWMNSVALVLAMKVNRLFGYISKCGGLGGGHRTRDRAGPASRPALGTPEPAFSGHGRSAAARTPNARFWRPVLYQLS